MDINTIASDIINTVTNDPNLDDELKEQILELAETAQADPTPGNLKALSIFFDKLSEANKYIGTMTSLRDLQVDKIIETQESSMPDPTE